eukprot:EG_transcript_12489
MLKIVILKSKEGQRVKKRDQADSEHNSGQLWSYWEPLERALHWVKLGRGLIHAEKPGSQELSLSGGAERGFNSSGSFVLTKSSLALPLPPIPGVDGLPPPSAKQ